jgi:hypothetical protein
MSNSIFNQWSPTTQDMTQSLHHHQDSSDEGGVPMQRSASFHYENARACRGLLHPIHNQLTSEDDESEDYGSGCDSSQVQYLFLYLIDFILRQLIKNN